MTVFIHGYFKNRQATLLNASILNINLLLIIICLTLEMLISDNSTETIIILDYIKGILSALVIYTSPRSIHSLYNYRIIPERLFLLVSTISVALVLFSKIFIKIPYLYTVVFSVMAFSILYSFFIGLLKKSKKLTKSLLIWVLSIISFLLVLAFDLFSFMTIFSYELSEKFHFLPISYILFSIAHLNKIRENPPRIDLKDIGITTRETEVVELITRGLKYSEIADELCISLSTVKKHITSVYKKTETSNKVELITLLRD